MVWHLSPQMVRAWAGHLCATAGVCGHFPPGAARHLPPEGSTVQGQGVNQEHSGQRKTSADTRGVQTWPTLGLATLVLNTFTPAKGKKIFFPETQL